MSRHEGLCPLALLRASKIVPIVALSSFSFFWLLCGRHHKQMLHEDVWSTLVLVMKELNYMMVLLTGFTGSFSKPLS